jgi:choline dehydrogenase-like flavoprotein
VLDAFAQAAQEAGIAATDDFNRGDNEGVGYFEVNQKRRLALEHGQGLPAPDLLRAAQFRDVDIGAGRPSWWSMRRQTARSAAPAHRSGTATKWSRRPPRAR